MNYGLSFREALEAQDYDLSQFDEPVERAMEVSMTQSAAQSEKTDQANNTMTTSAVNETQDNVEKATNEGEKILKMIQNRHASTLKVLNNTWTSNEKFLEEFGNYQNQYKQLDQVTLINWSYGHNADQYLIDKLTQLRAVITRNAGYLNNWQNIPSDALIAQSGKALDKALISAMGAPSSIETPHEFMGHLRTQFRGKKSQKTYRGDMVNQYVNEIRSFAKTKTSYSQNINSAERLAKSIQSSAQNLMRSNNFSDQDKATILKYQRNLNRMLALYVNMIYFVYRLATEYILNRRVLVTKLFEK